MALDRKELIKASVIQRAEAPWKGSYLIRLKDDRLLKLSSLLISDTEAVSACKVSTTRVYWPEATFHLRSVKQVFQRLYWQMLVYPCSDPAHSWGLQPTSSYCWPSPALCLCWLFHWFHLITFITGYSLLLWYAYSLLASLGVTCMILLMIDALNHVLCDSCPEK